MILTVLPPKQFNLYFFSRLKHMEYPSDDWELCRQTARGITPAGEAAKIGVMEHSVASHELVVSIKIISEECLES